MKTGKEALEKQIYGNPPSDYSEVVKLSERLDDLTATVDAATERWMELAERLE